VSASPPLRAGLTIVCLIAVAVLGGCAVNRETASVTPGIDVSGLHRFHVVKFGPDERGINNMIAGELVKMGYAATTGPEDAAPDNCDALVTYWDKWMWDITMYMIELDVTVRDPETSNPLAVGNSYHTSLTRRSPQEMVREVLSNIFEKPAAQ